ncbi:MAG: tetratricopeptide repeat protein, partial [Chloroflexota bacterium]|nr:tetratricopeptide repeat protein [Chloroflexota bacterium]
RAFGDKPSIVLHGAGGHTSGGDHGLARMIAVTAAGPAAGIGLGLLIVLVARLASPAIASSPLVGDAIFLTIGLSLFNLIPMGGFDGATILNGLVTLAIGRPAGTAGWMIGAFTVFAIVIVALALGRYEIAIILVVIVVANSTQASSIPAAFGGGSPGAGTPVGLLNLGRADEALVLAEEASRRDPKNREAALARGSALQQLTRYTEAESVYDGLLDAKADDFQALSGRFAARRALGRPDEAAADLAALLTREPVDVHETSAQFLGLYYDGQYERALDLLRTRLAQPGVARPEALHLRMLEAAVESVAGYPEAALRHSEEVTGARPDMAGLHEIAALALLQLGQVEAAAIRARRALSGAPRHPELMETVGIAERLAGRPEVALDLLVQSAAARPELPRARAELSICFTQLGRTVEAAAALGSLPAWSADDPFVLYARACILTADGRIAEAAGLVARAAERRPALGWIARVDPLLRSLGLSGIAQATGRENQATGG